MMDNKLEMPLEQFAEAVAKENARLISGPGGIMEMKQTIADKEREIERLQDKCDKQAEFLRRINPERFPDTLFIHSLVGKKDENGMPEKLLIVPAYGVDFSYVYEYNGKITGTEW